MTSANEEVALPDSPRGVVRTAQEAESGGALGERELFPCPANSLFSQPANDCASWTSAYTSAIGADFAYTCFDDFWGVNGPICDLHFWGLALRWSNGWLAGDPTGLVFQVKFYAPGGPPFTEVCAYTVQPQVTHLCTWGSFLDFWQFDVPSLTPCCTLSYGWISIQSLPDADGDLFLWLDAGPGAAYQHDGTNYNPLQLNLGFCLTGQFGGVGACCFNESCHPLPEQVCLDLGGWYLGDGTDCEWNPCHTPPLVCIDPTLIHTVKCFTPLEWQPKLENWPGDANGNFVDDAIDAMPPNARVEVLVDVNRCPTDADLSRFRAFGLIGYRSPFLSVVQLRGVRVGDTPLLALDEAVAMVELNRTVTRQLDISTRAIRVRASGTYSPATVEDMYGLTGAGVGVAILDTGVDDGLHESLPAWKFVGGYNVFTHLVGNPDDDMGHGTHVAGIAIGTGGGSGTYRGVAPGASLIDVKVLNSSGSGTLAGVIEGIDFCIASRAAFNIRVINMSLGASFPSNGTDATSQAANNAVREGIVTAVAAGNSGPGAMTLGVPAVADDVITVAASAHVGTVARGDDVIATFSSRGPRLDDGDTEADELKPDVAAPGTNIASPGCTGMCACTGGIMSATWNTVSGYCLTPGTSMATPHVAGLAALILQFVPGMTPQSVKDLIKSTAEDFGPVGWDAAWGDGLINGYQAINQLASTLPVDLKFNDPGCCHSTDLIPLNPMIVEGVPNTIRARVTNGSATPAFNFKVRIGVYGFSNGQADYQVCLVTVPGPLAPGATMDIDCAWTPLVSGTPPGVVHACLKAEIIFPYDSNFGNNFAQHNINIQQSFSPARYRLEVLNPTDCDIFVYLQWLMDPPDARWVFHADPMEFELGGREAPRNVEMELNPLEEEPPPVRVSVRAIGITLAGQVLDLGGAVIFAQHDPLTDCNGNGVDDWIDVRTGTSRDDDGDGVPDECRCKGDCNCDGVVDFDDINPFVAALSGVAPCNFANLDINEDGVIDFGDINGFVAILANQSGPCGQ